MKEIKSTSGKIILVDDDMYEILSQYSWHMQKGKAVREIWENGKRTERVQIHRFVAGAKTGDIVRHIDGNTLNNQRVNLTIIRSDGVMRPRTTPYRHGMRNEYEVRSEQTVIFLNRQDGTKLEAVIETDDLQEIKEITGTWVAQWNPFTKSFYVVMGRGSAKSRERLLLHRVIMQPSEDYVVDHINRDTLDNRRTNLRIVSSWGNSQNTIRSNKHGARGVRWSKKDKKYSVVIKYQGQDHYLGSFEDRKVACIVSSTARKLIEKIENIS